jgi:hypothetical protein
MATPVIVSTGITVANQKKRSLPMFLPNATTLAQAQAFMTAFATLLDNVIDGVVVDPTVTLPLTLPGGIKSSPSAGAESSRGALLDYAASGIDRIHGIWVPSWAPAGFSGNAVDNAGAYATFISALVNVIGSSGAAPVDRYGNDLTTFTKGRKAFRK